MSSKDLNEVRFTGRLGADPEISYTPRAGKLVVKFSAACNRTIKHLGEEPVEKVERVHCVLWEKLAEVYANLLHKGTRILGSGRMETSSWEAADGTKRYKTEIILSDIILLDTRPAPIAQAAPPADDEPDLAENGPAPSPAHTNRATPPPQGAPIPAVGANRPAKNRPPAADRPKTTAKERPYRPYRDGYTDPDDIAF